MKQLVQGCVPGLRGSGLEPWSLCASSPVIVAEATRTQKKIRPDF